MKGRMMLKGKGRERKGEAGVHEGSFGLDTGGAEGVMPVKG